MENDHVELSNMRASPAPGLPEQDIMQLARHGDIVTIQNLYDQGKFDPKYRDEEGITPLHVRIRWWKSLLARKLIKVAIVGRYQQ